MSLSGAIIEGASFDVETIFGDGRAVDSTRLALRLDPPLPAAIDIDDEEDLVGAPPGTRELVRSLKEGARHAVVNEDRIEVELQGPTPDPSALQPRMLDMLALARRLRGERTAGPYR
jgi:hypothetical protein